MFGQSYFGGAHFGPTYFPPGELIQESNGGTGGRKKKKDPPIFITNMEEKRRLDKLAELEELALLEFDAIPDTIEPVSDIIGLDEFQKIELMAFLERMEEQDREEMLRLEADELLAIMLLLH